MRTTMLAAVLFVEAAGFDELLQRDEGAALRSREAWRELALPLAAEHGGEVLDSTGTELLVVFASAVAALQCALHLDLALAARRSGLPPGGLPGRAMELRAGIHLGELWRDESRVYGDGVNVAARVMQAASPGDILVSEDVFRQVSNKLDLEFRLLPDRGLKNIERPLRLYKLERGGAPAARVQEPAVPSAAPAPPPPPPGAEAETSPGEGRKAREVTIKGARGHFDLDIDLGSGRNVSISTRPLRTSGDSAAGGRVEPAPAGPDPDARHAAAVAELAAGARRLAGGGIACAALAWAWFRWDSPWAAAGAILIGFLPAMSGLKRLLKAALELGDARRDRRR